MKVGDLVKAPWFTDRDKAAVGIVIEIVVEDPDGFLADGPGTARILWVNGKGHKHVFPHMLEVISARR
jgi:hypothetical protein